MKFKIPNYLTIGRIINVPLFVQENEVIRVDTREKKYIERMKN